MKIRFWTDGLETQCSGGIKQIYRQAAVLALHGYDAAVVCGKDSPVEPWFRTSAPRLEEMDAGDGDFVVICELDSVHRVPDGARVVVYAQGAFLVPLGMGGPYRFQKSYEFVDAVLCVSEHSKQSLEWLFPDMPIHRIIHSVRAPFVLGENKGKLLSFMPRKRREEMDTVLGILDGMGALKGWKVEPIEDMNEEQVADVMRRSAVYMSGCEREGFGLPVIEAMACGCVVVGYHGYGGAEIFEHGCRHVPEGDFLAFAREMSGVLGLSKERLRDEGVCASERVLAEYSEEVETDSILDAWRLIENKGRIVE